MAREIGQCALCGSIIYEGDSVAVIRDGCLFCTQSCYEETRSPVYHIEKDGKYLTGNIQKGRYEYISSFELRYTFEDIKRAEFIAGMYAGTVIQE
jgi:hypothetical protein